MYITNDKTTFLDKLSIGNICVNRARVNQP